MKSDDFAEDLREMQAIDGVYVVTITKPTMYTFTSGSTITIADSGYVTIYPVGGGGGGGIA